MSMSYETYGAHPVFLQLTNDAEIGPLPVTMSQGGRLVPGSAPERF